MDENIKRSLKEFIANRFMEGQASINDNDSLFEMNVIDSLSMLELLAFIEENFSISINPSEIMIDNFDSVNKITRLIKDKKRRT